jgi:hypothetical protein
MVRVEDPMPRGLEAFDGVQPWRLVPNIWLDKFEVSDPSHCMRHWRTRRKRYKVPVIG